MSKKRKRKRGFSQRAVGEALPKKVMAAEADKSPQKAEEEKAPTSVTGWVLSLIWKTRYRRSILGVITLVALGISGYPAFKWFRDKLPHTHPFPANPVVISIQPEGEFGDLRADGLTRGLTTTESLGVVRIRATIADMKARRIDGMLAELLKRIGEHNVIAIVGPSISECTKDILDCVESSGAKIPVIIESSSPRDSLGWNTRPFPLFRLSSGIDERALEVAQFARQLTGAGANVAFLIERVPNAESYGELLYKHTRGHFDKKTLERIQIHFFDHSRVGDMVSQTQMTDLFASNSVVFLLGLGNDFYSVMNAFFRVESMRSHARLIGIMCAYRTATSLKQGGYRRSQVIELTDVSRLSHSLPGTALKALQDAYRSDSFDPALRDQAFSFDAGLCLAYAMRDVLRHRNTEPSMTYEDAINHVALNIMNNVFDGASGRVAFGGGEKPRGQNVGSALQLVRMDDQGNWNPVSMNQVLELPKQ